MTQDESNLDLLSIFHFVLGGITALFACIPFLHLFMGIAIVSGALGSDENMPIAFGWLFIIFPAMMILSGWAIAICMIIAGIKLKKRRNYTFCLVMACIECIMMPLGTILGVFTLVMLFRDPIKALFNPRVPPPVPTQT